MTLLNATHDPALTSWVPSANTADTDFPIQNLPFGRFRRVNTTEPWSIGVAIGDHILDLKLAAEAGTWSTETGVMLAALALGELNVFMARSPAAWSQLRAELSAALASGSAQQERLDRALLPQSEAQMTLPCAIGDYTDFYTGIHHATAIGKQFRPDEPLLPNYRWVPIGYHGRVSSIGVSGQRFPRPSGQTRGAAGTPGFGPCQRLDYELELGLFVGPGNAQGQPIPMTAAEDHLFGVCLLNDWSARDLQAWEYQPLGPFLSKSFATTLSPWIVTMEALAPYRTAFTRPAGDPEPLAYLDSAFNRASGAVDIQLEVWLQTAAMRDLNLPAERLTQSSTVEACYWTFAQLVAHHTVNGCNLQSGDLLGSGTLSGPRPEQSGSLLELSAGGKQPFRVGNGESRTFLEDGDTVILRGHCSRPGAARIGLGEVSGTVMPAVPAT